VLPRAKRRSDELDHKFNLVLGSAPIVERALDVSHVLTTPNVVTAIEQALVTETLAAAVCARTASRR
jgi:hypothetical protein